MPWPWKDTRHYIEFTVIKSILWNKYLLQKVFVLLPASIGESDFFEQGASERLIRRDWVEQRLFLRGFDFKLSDYFQDGRKQRVNVSFWG